MTNITSRRAISAITSVIDVRGCLFQIGSASLLFLFSVGPCPWKYAPCVDLWITGWLALITLWIGYCLGQLLQRVQIESIELHLRSRLQRRPPHPGAPKVCTRAFGCFSRGNRAPDQCSKDLMARSPQEKASRWIEQLSQTWGLLALCPF